MPRTKRECQTILFNLGIKFGVSPKSIATRLLSDQDKLDMMEGVLTIEALEAHIAVWIDNGKFDRCLLR